MPISDYAGWNEDALIMWWLEEGCWPDEPDYDDYDYDEGDK